MKLGTTRIIHSYQHFIHIIKLQDYIDNVNKIRKSIETLTEITNITNNTTDTFHINMKFKNLETKLNSILPKSRNKRGIINGLGSVIKIISGNMDAEDAEKINKEISKLGIKQDNLNKQYNKQITINEKMINRFKNITDHINLQQESIEKYLRKFKSKIDNDAVKYEHLLDFLQYVNTINFNIDILNDHLNNIMEAIILAKLNIISKQILTQQELNEIHKIFDNEYIKIQSEQEMYEFLELQAYYHEQNIIFNVKIPIVSNSSYSMYHIIPLPINESYEIIVSPFAILNNKEIYELDKKCTWIEGIFYCQHSSLKNRIDTHQCLRNIIENKPAKCKFIHKDIFNRIYQPEENFIICMNIPETNFNSSCGTPFSKLQGTLLLHFENCTIEVNDITYTSKSNVYWDNIIIHPTLNHIINVTNITEEITLEKLKNWQLEHQEELDIFHVDIQQKQNLIYGIILTIVIFIAYLGLRKLFKRQDAPNKQHLVTPTCPPTFENSMTNFLWPNVHLRGEELHSSPPLTLQPLTLMQTPYFSPTNQTFQSKMQWKDS